jgi:hypothetical protein
MTTMTTKTQKVAARKAYLKAKLEFLAARTQYVTLNRERDELCSGYHTEPEEYDCNLACQAARAKMGFARTCYLKTKAALKAFFTPPTRVTSPARHVLLIAA